MGGVSSIQFFWDVWNFFNFAEPTAFPRTCCKEQWKRREDEEGLETCSGQHQIRLMTDQLDSTQGRTNWRKVMAYFHE